MIIGEDIYVGTNLSANVLRDILRQLLVTFDIPVTDLRIFLREDRDAARDCASSPELVQELEHCLYHG